jgi:serine/threonine protein phosphatase PrpC
MNPMLLTAAGNPQNQDRGIVILGGPMVALCVADGAGGLSGGAEAAIKATDFVRRNSRLANTAESCSELLLRMDAAIANDSAAGETTCVLTVVTPEDVFGASVGDSGAWLIPEGGVHLDLTRAQRRKPLIGVGGAWPIPFHHPRQSGRLLLATDGLLKYASAELIVETCSSRRPTDEAAQRLIELVRYPSGALPDDVTVILTEF